MAEKNLELNSWILNCMIFVVNLSKIILLRRSLKIKALFIFLAWMMIFAHGIVPHNHIDADAGEYTGYHHNHQKSGEAAEFRQICTDAGTCSISNILFQKFASDDNSLIPENNDIIGPFLPAERYIPTRDRQNPSGILPQFVFLRAPPLA